MAKPDIFRRKELTAIKLSIAKFDIKNILKHMTKFSQKIVLRLKKELFCVSHVENNKSDCSKT